MVRAGQYSYLADSVSDPGVSCVPAAPLDAGLRERTHSKNVAVMSSTAGGARAEGCPLLWRCASQHVWQGWVDMLDGFLALLGARVALLTSNADINGPRQ